MEGFGSLRGEYIFSSDRCNLVLEPNESGKSTLAAALLAALYGFPRQRATRERPIKMKEQYRPWSGGPFALEMEVEARERAFVVRRDFERDTAVVYDARTGKEITSEFAPSKDRVDPGEILTGLSREDFARCCFVGQREIDDLRDAAGLTHSLQRMASSQQGDVAAGEALAALQRAAERDYEGLRLGRGRVETEIKRLDAEIDEVRLEMEAIGARRRESEEKIRRLEAASLEEDKAELALARADYLCLAAARGETREEIERCRRDDEELRRVRAELQELEPFGTFPAHRLGLLRELKGKSISLGERRVEAERRLREEVEAPLRTLRAALEARGALAALGPDDAARFAERQAVLADLWLTRRGKKVAMRREDRRLRDAGVEPGRVAALAGRFASLSEEERSFLSLYRERLFETRADLTDAERRRQHLAHREGAEAALVPLGTARRAEGIALALGFLGAVLAPILLFTQESKLPFVAALLVTGTGFIWWLRQQERRPAHGAEEFGSDLQRLQTDIWNREKELASLQERLAGMAFRMDYGKADLMLEEFRELESLQDRAAPLAALAASLAEVQGRYDAAAGDLVELMARAGGGVPRRRLAPRLARRFAEELRTFAEARERAAALERKLEAGRADLAALQREAASVQEGMSELFRAGLGEDAAGSVEERIERFERAAAKRERRDSLLRDVLPAHEGRRAGPPGSRAETLEREAEVLVRQIEKALRRNPEFEPLVPERSSREYADDRRRLQEDIRSSQRERLALSEELGDVLKEFRRDYPGRQAMIERLEAARARAVAFRDAVAVASEVLTAISREAYAEWAEVLNERTGEILRRICPHYDDVRFDTDLSFTLRDARTMQRRDRDAVDAQFSAGARDQIYLAVRIAVSEYLSAAGLRLPFVLDDTFASLDDARFERSMEFLMETVARRHQVILLSCHEERHRRWLERYADRLADRVRLLDLTPLSA